MKVHIEFCIKWNYDPEFDRVSAIIRSIDSCIEISSNQVPPRSGSFEVAIDDRVVFSKFKSGGFPDEKEVSSWFKRWEGIGLYIW